MERPTEIGHGHRLAVRVHFSNCACGNICRVCNPYECHRSPQFRARSAPNSWLELLRSIVRPGIVVKAPVPVAPPAVPVTQDLATPDNGLRSASLPKLPL